MSPTGLRVPLSVLVLACLLGTAAGCGSSRPDEADLTQALARPNALVPVPKEAAPCVARVLEDSELSEGTLHAIVDDDAKRWVPAKDARILDGLDDEMSACIPR